jgi:aminomethyltransferase
MKTILYDRHLELKAKMVEFGGWQMPLQYTGVLEEHMAVRNNVGIFDVSHMGIIIVTGKDSGKLLDYISTNHILGRDKNTAIYTVWAHENGGCVDDVIVYSEDDNHYFVVINASNRVKSLEHIKKYAQGYDVHIQDRFQEDGILAIQGPNSQNLISPLFLEAKTLKKMHFVSLKYHGEKIILSRTGYTGELGFEIYAPNKLIVELFDWFINEGKPFKIACVGLGARDTLRLEMGYTLYGHEISDTISANESLSKWTIKADKPHFVGLKYMQKLENSSALRNEYGVILEGPGIPREGFDVYLDDSIVGKVTSGSFSPVLNKAIAIILVNTSLNVGSFVNIKIRQNFCPAKVSPLPFV